MRLRREHVKRPQSVLAREEPHAADEIRLTGRCTSSGLSFQPPHCFRSELRVYGLDCKLWRSSSLADVCLSKGAHVLRIWQGSTQRLNGLDDWQESWSLCTSTESLSPLASRTPPCCVTLAFRTHCQTIHWFLKRRLLTVFYRSTASPSAGDQVIPGIETQLGASTVCE